MRASPRLSAVFFFFQAEDGIRDYKVTGVQTCALPIYGLGNEELISQTEREPERLDAGGRIVRGTGRRAIRADGVDVDRVGVLLGHDQRAAVAAERDLRRSDRCPAEGAAGPRNRRCPAVRIEREAGDVAAAGTVQDVEHVAPHGQADGLRSAGWNPAGQREARRADAEDGDIVAARVDGE